MNSEPRIYTTDVGGHPFTIETGILAAQAGGAVTVRVADSILFAAATMGSEPKESQDFFPLTVEYEEKLYAGGRIPGSYFRREGRPSGDAILTARLTDRPLRPLFSADMRNEVQVIMSALSADPETPLDILAVNAASAALTISDIPWNGPVGCVRIGRIDGNWVVNPTYAQIEQSDLDLRIAGTRDAILMVECGANEVNEDDMVEALMFGHRSLQPIIELQIKMGAEIGKPKREVKLFSMDQTLVDQVIEQFGAQIKDKLNAPLSKEEFNTAMAELEAQAISAFTNPENEDSAAKTKEAFHEAMKRAVRSRIVNESKRPDGRSLDEIRPIWCKVGYSPRAHGSGLFTRGETQVLTLATLGTPKEAQEIDSLSPIDSKRYMHHYNFPPYSTGEVKRLGGQSRREVGHGALAERALIPVLPTEEEFPYTMRLVSEVMSSNGSSSMASVCGSTLALMDTGVPIKAPVAGVAMGLIKEGERYVILTDIQGAEDHLGDMDFKVAGTSEGITALQMDIKIQGITSQIMSGALSQAKTARNFILGKILETISAPRPELKSHVPRITTIKIPQDKIGALIGPGGKNIRALQEETHTKIDIDDDGTVFISAVNGLDESQARDRILAMTESAQIGHIYTGKVVRIESFGAFVQILPGVDGMVHISQLDSERVNTVEDIAHMGEELTVMVTGIDENGKIRLSRQAVLEGWTPEEAASHDRPRSGSSNSRDRNSGSREGGNNRRDFRRDGQGNNRRNRQN